MNKYQNITTDSGFTLIEVLVALLIVALGMLGNAMLQLQGMKNSNDAYLRSRLVFLLMILPIESGPIVNVRLHIRPKDFFPQQVLMLLVRVLLALARILAPLGMGGCQMK